MKAEATLSSIVLGTRGSELALVQAALAQAALERAHPALAVRQTVVRTSGDQRPDLALTEFSRQHVLDKGIFTKELEIELASGSIDAAVHSLKDVPTEIDPAFQLAAFLPREPVHDVLVTRSPLPGGLRDLPLGARVATSSIRRRRQFQWVRPDLQVEDIRGNVPTRIRQLFQPQGPDAIALAFAGLHRLGWISPGQELFHMEGAPLHVTHLPPDVCLPAAGQGAVALEIRSTDDCTRVLLAAIDHPPTRTRAETERAFLALLQAGCHTPVGILTSLEDGMLKASARVFREDAADAPPLEAEYQGPGNDPEAAARHLFRQVRSQLES